jgi:hypothetical protein
VAKTRFQNALEAKIADVRQRYVESIVTGVDERTYREYVGIIAGLNAAIKLCEEIEMETT